MTKKKNKFFTFCFSLIPGAGEMYMGFMKQGVSIMGLFFSCCALSGFLNFPFLLFVTPIIWFYSFFNVHNLKSLSEEEFYGVEDDYILHLNSLPAPNPIQLQKTHKLIPIFLIFFGLSILWTNIMDIVYRFFSIWQIPDYVYSLIRTVGSSIPRIIVAIVIILLGIRMIHRKKAELLTDGEDMN